MSEPTIQSLETEIKVLTNQMAALQEELRLRTDHLRSVNTNRWFWIGIVALALGAAIGVTDLVTLHGRVDERVKVVTNELVQGKVKLAVEEQEIKTKVETKVNLAVENATVDLTKKAIERVSKSLEDLAPPMVTTQVKLAVPKAIEDAESRISKIVEDKVEDLADDQMIKELQEMRDDGQTILDGLDKLHSSALVQVSAITNLRQVVEEDTALLLELAKIIEIVKKDEQKQTVFLNAALVIANQAGESAVKIYAHEEGPVVQYASNKSSRRRAGEGFVRDMTGEVTERKTEALVKELVKRDSQ